jgi:uncharacterized protein YgbK (DUF1537 family)
VIAIVADDLTGACDSASPFLRGGPVQVAIWPHLPESAELACVAVSTDGRDQDTDEARARARTATAHLMALGARPFKKVDSRMRGHVAAELAGVLDAWPGRVLLCPALPGEGRLTIDRHQVVGDEVTDLAELAAGLGDRVLLRDAASDADLDRVAAEVLAAPDLLPAGSAGLAAALARAVFAADEVTEPSGTGWAGARRPLGLVGSKTEVSAEQLVRAVEAGWEIRRRTRHDPVELDGYDALFMSGGSTAHGVLAQLGAHGLELLGDAVPRAPVGRVLGGDREGLLVCVKSGGFGGPDAVATIFDRLVQGG